MKRTFVVLMAAFGSVDALGGGFQLFEQSVKGLGSAFSDQATASDASTVFWNPAGLTRLKGDNVSVAGQVIKATGRFSDQGTRTFLPPPNGLPMSGGNGGDPGDYTGIPNLYYAHQLNNKWTVGLGVNAPFGLATKYDNNWVGRYYALNSELQTLNINPSFGVRLNEKISVGGGLNVEYAKAKLSNAIDFSTVCLAQAAAVPALGPLCAASGYTTPGNAATDGKVTVKGDDWALGWNVGVMFDVSPDTRVGVAYRSKLSHDIKGDATFSKPATLPAPIGAVASFTDGGVRTSIVLPETATVALHTSVSKDLNVTASATWTRWSRLQELRLRFDNGAADAATPLEWRDTWRVAVGGEYRINSSWALRAGIAYDQTPVKSNLRTPRVPDADRLMLSMGATYRISPDASVDLGYAHWFVHDAAINLATAAGGTLVGTYQKPYIDVVGVQYNHRFR